MLKMSSVIDLIKGKYEVNWYCSIITRFYINIQGRIVDLLDELGGRTGANTSAAKFSNIVLSTWFLITESKQVERSSKLRQKLKR